MALTERSLSRLQGVNPVLAGLIAELRARSPVNFQITEGMRDANRQRELVAAGKSQTMNSRHLGGNAVDIHIVGDDGKAIWDFAAYEPLGELAKQIAQEKAIEDFVWGGDWKTLRDGVHFQVGGPNPSAAPMEQPSQPLSYNLPPVETNTVGTTALPPFLEAPQETPGIDYAGLYDALMGQMQQQAQQPQQPLAPPMPARPIEYVRRDTFAPYRQLFQRLGA